MYPQGPQLRSLILFFRPIVWFLSFTRPINMLQYILYERPQVGYAFILPVFILIFGFNYQLLRMADASLSEAGK